MVTRGWYRHYKGHAYYVHGVAYLAQEGNRRVVIYTSVDTEEVFNFLVRYEEEFEELVDGFPRFEPVTLPDLSLRSAQPSVPDGVITPDVPDIG